MKIIYSLILAIFLVSFISADSYNNQFDVVNCYQNSTPLINGTCEQILCDSIKLDSSSELSGLLIDANQRLSSNVTYYKDELNSCKKTQSINTIIIFIAVGYLAILSVIKVIQRWK